MFRCSCYNAKVKFVVHLLRCLVRYKAGRAAVEVVIVEFMGSDMFICLVICHKGLFNPVT